MKTKVQPAIAVACALLVLALSVYSCLTDDRMAKVRLAKEALSAAGYADVEIDWEQNPRELTRCAVGQIRHKGRAYAWRTPTAHGLYCAPEDGRPHRIIVESGQAATK